tara:strand:- start:234 stop:1097 length:864 start_codon:yes stop_codon:yes gene_type:complete
MRSHRLRAAAGGAGGLVTTNLNRHYDFGDTNSYSSSSFPTVNDLSGNGYGATWENTQSLAPTFSSSNGGYVILGTNQVNYLKSDNTNIGGSSNTSFNQALTRLAGTGNFTIEFWVNIHTPPSGYSSQYSYLYSDWPSEYIITYNPFSLTIKNYRMSLYIQNGGWGSFGLDGSSNIVGQGIQYSQWTTNTYTSTGNQGWEHIVVSRTSTGTNGLKFYRNNTLEFTGTNSINYNCNVNVNSTGDKTYGDRQYSGTLAGTYIAIIREYLYGFTAADVATNFNADRARFGL